MAQTAPRRPSKRRQRVLEGALAAIATHGVEGLTHRRVAEAGGVSVSATTYHFATLEDLLESAIRYAAERNLADMRERFHDAPPTLDEFVDYVVEAVQTRRQETIVASELYTAALRRDHLRDIAAEWDRAWTELLQPIVGDNAEAVTAAIGGLLMRAALYEDRREAAEFAGAIRQLLLALATSRGAPAG